MKTLSCLIIFSAVTFSAFAQNASSPSSRGDEFYNKGECEPAIREFQATLGANKMSAEDSEKIRFKIAYCQFELSKYAEAEVGFRDYLQKNSNDDEAKLKYAQSLLYQNKYKAAKAAAQNIKNEEYQLQATIVIARTQIETDDSQSAIKTLRPFVGEKPSPEALYWEAVALYNSDQDQAAEKTFEKAKVLAGEESWVKSDSQGWIDRIRANDSRFHFQLSLGYINDSNIAQAGGTMSFNPGQVGAQKPVVTTNYISDGGPYASLDLYYNAYQSRKSYLTATMSGSSPFYKNNPSYNSEYFSFDLSYSYIASKETTYGVSAKYLESMYNNLFSQDYFIATPYVSSYLSPDLWLKFSLPATMYLAGKNIYNVAPSVDSRYELATWAGFNYGASFTKSFAPVVKIVDGPPAVVTAGTMFTHYTALSLYAGLSFELPADFSLSVSDTVTKTSYELEDVPVPTGSQAPSPREDTLMTYNATLSKALIKNIWSASLSATYYDNKSKGFLGLASSGSLTSNTYTRTYVMATTTLYY